MKALSILLWMKSLNINSSKYDESISELEALQQHIKSLESQLSSNPLQLNCDGCEFDTNGRNYGCYRFDDCIREHTRKDKNDRYKRGDTK